MTTNSGESGSAAKAGNPKKANLMDPHSIKHLLDESVSDVSLSLSTFITIPKSLSFVALDL